MRPFIIIVVVLIVTLQFSCKPKPGEQTTGQPKKITDKGVNIAYTDTGKGDTTLLFVHWLGY